MPGTMEGRIDYVERAAKSYAEFRRRTDRNGVLTRTEKAERLESFLDAHVSIFDEYFEEWDRYRKQAPDREMLTPYGDGLSEDARRMALDVAALFSDSVTGRFYLKSSQTLSQRQTLEQGAGAQAQMVRENHYRAQGSFLDRRGADLLTAGFFNSAERNSNLGIVENKFQEMMRKTALDFNPQAAMPAPPVMTPRQAAAQRVHHAEEEAEEAQLQADAARALAERSRAEVKEAETRQKKAKAKALAAGAMASEARGRELNVRAEQARAEAAGIKEQAAGLEKQAADLKKQAARARAGKQEDAAAIRRQYHDARSRAAEAEARAAELSARAADLERQAALSGAAAVRNWDAAQAMDKDWTARVRERAARQQPPAAEAHERAVRIRREAEDAARQAEEAKERARAARTQANALQAHASETRQEYVRVRNEASADPVVHFRTRRLSRTDGLTPEQIRRVRDISAFLYRNTLFGWTEGARENTGFFVDGVLGRPPIIKLLMFYLIEKDKMHGKLGKEEVIQALLYEPDLETFKTKILHFARGVFSRSTGDSLHWDKLTDAAHTAEDMMPEVYNLLGMNPAAAAAAPAPAAAPGAAAAAGGAQLDPALDAAIQAVVNSTRLLLENPAPDRAAVDAYKAAVDALNGYLKSQDKDVLGKAGEGSRYIDLFVGNVAKPLSSIANILSGISGAEGTGAGFSWGAVPLGSVNALASFATALNSLREIGKQKGKLNTAKQIGRFIKDISASLSSSYSSVIGFAKLLDAGWMSAALSTAGAGAGIAVGVMAAAQGIHRKREAKKEQAALLRLEDEARRYQPQGALSPQQLAQLEAEKQTLIDLAKTSRAGAARRELAGRAQALSGGLQAAAGTIMIVTGGTGAIIAGVLSGAAFVTALSSTIMSYVQKKAEREQVVDRFIDMDLYYDEFIQNRMAPGKTRAAVEKEHGGSKELRKYLRQFAVRALGFSSIEKMHAYIMRQYARALYKGAFLKPDGTLLTAAEAAQNAGHRKLYTQFLEAIGFRIKYRDPNAVPPVSEVYPDENAIFKKLMS